MDARLAGARLDAPVVDLAKWLATAVDPETPKPILRLDPIVDDVAERSTVRDAAMRASRDAR